jgi:hypothetical protein
MARLLQRHKGVRERLMAEPKLTHIRRTVQHVPAPERPVDHVTPSSRLVQGADQAHRTEPVARPADKAQR